MEDLLPLARLGTLTCGGAVAWLLARHACAHPPAPRPTLGQRGLQRGLAIDAVPGFRTVEPAVRTLAGWLGPHLSVPLQQRLDTRLRTAGLPLGLSAPELLALSGITATGGALLGAASAALLNLGPWAPWCGALLLGAMPVFRIDERAHRRLRSAERDLPPMIELLAMAMDAGLDFAGALAHVAGDGAAPGPLTEELQQVRAGLALGHTRRQALEEFAARMPSPSVRQLVAAAVQAQEAGNPLASVLRIQATALRDRRTVLAEEAANRAALMLVLPMMMMLCCVLLLLMGPTFLRMGTQ